LIITLLITIVVETIIVIGYCRWRDKPRLPVVFTSIAANLVTQSLLWIALLIFFRHYLLTLLVAEGLIWIVESLLLYFVPVNQLYFREALFLSLGMNLASFGVGWFLPL
jgi:hypothetical protein